MKKNNKPQIIVISIVVLVALGCVWFYLNQNPPISHQFKGTVLEVRDDNLAMIGDYVKLGENKPTVVGSEVVAVFFNKNTKIIKNTLETVKGAGFDKSYESGQQTQKTASVDELKTDLKENNLVLTINTSGNIYDTGVFMATNIEYTVLVFK